jgi:hypothetical protein
MTIFGTIVAPHPRDSLTAPPAVYPCALHRDLCYRPLSQDDIAHPIFPLHCHPNVFLVAQIPGLRPDDHRLIAWIDPRNPKGWICLLDIVSYERILLASLEFLRTQVIPRAKESFPVLDEQYMLTLTFLCMCHRKWLNNLETILESQDRDRIGEIITALTQDGDVVAATKEYARQLELGRATLVDASIKYTPLFQSKLKGETIHQVMTLPLRWRAEVTQTSKGLASALLGTRSAGSTSLLARWISMADSE